MEVLMPCPPIPPPQESWELILILWGTILKELHARKRFIIYLFFLHTYTAVTSQEAGTAPPFERRHLSVGHLIRRPNQSPVTASVKKSALYKHSSICILMHCGIRVTFLATVALDCHRAVYSFKIWFYRNMSRPLICLNGTVCSLAFSVQRECNFWKFRHLESTKQIHERAMIQVHTWWLWSSVLAIDSLGTPSAPSSLCRYAPGM